jgi:hypothetical protein
MNITRIINLLRANFIEDKKILLILSIIVFFVATLEAISGLLEVSPVITYGCVIFVAGMFFHTPLRKDNGTHVFHLPVTAGEKLINAVMVLISATITFHIIMLIGTYLGYYGLRPFFGMGGNNILVKDGLSIVKLSIMNFNGYLFFAMALAIFLFGSIYFKGRAMLKTIATSIGLLLGFAIYAIALLAIAFRGTSGSRSLNISGDDINIVVHPFFQNHYYIFPVLIIVFFLSLTYLRLRETEV